MTLASCRSIKFIKLNFPPETYYKLRQQATANNQQATSKISKGKVQKSKQPQLKIPLDRPTDIEQPIFLFLFLFFCQPIQLKNLQPSTIFQMLVNVEQKKEKTEKNKIIERTKLLYCLGN